MSVNLFDVALFGTLFLSVTANVVLIWFTRKLAGQFSDTISQVDDLGVEIDAFIGATEALCESEVYLLGEEPVVRSVRSNAKMVLKRLNALLRNIPNTWQLSEMEQTENLNDEQE
jgi:hypothetical protein